MVLSGFKSTFTYIVKSFYNKNIGEQKSTSGCLFSHRRSPSTSLLWETNSLQGSLKVFDFQRPLIIDRLNFIKTAKWRCRLVVQQKVQDRNQV